MAVKIFLDANILLDFMLKREFYDEAKAVLQLAVSGQAEAYITSSVLHITAYWTGKKYGAKISKKILSDLLTYVTIIDIKHETAVVALHSQIDDVEDALQYYTALHHKLDYFISRDKKLKTDGIPSLPVIKPVELLEQLM